MATTTRRVVVSVLLAAATCGCTDMSTPAELSHAQIVAVRADPPVVPPGGTASLSVLVAGPAGVLAPTAVRWGDNVVVGDAGEPLFVAPEQVEDGGAMVLVDLEVEVEGEVLMASKRVGVGVGAPAENPAIAEILADGEPLGAGGLPLRPGSAVSLALEVTPPPTDAAIYAWYSTVGEIDLYRRSPTELQAPEEASTGTMIAVFRDGLGVAWRVLPVTAAP